MHNPGEQGTSGPTIPGPELLPGRKRPRVGWSPEKGNGDAAIDWVTRINNDMDFCKGKIGTAALAIKTDKVVNLGASLADIMTNTMVSIFERQANTFSDFVVDYGKVCDENAFLREELAKVQEEVKSTKLSKERVEVKASRKEMEEKVEVANTQFKVLDVNIGRDFADRKAMTEAAKAAVQGKVRSDLRSEYDNKIRNATFKVMAKNTFKRLVDGQEIWTAPVLVTIPEREVRWEVEDTLRKSRVFPSFHWPKEMMDNIKAYRTTLATMGFNDKDYYIRIRPEDRDGVWKVRADAKAKVGDANRFIPVASFGMPPLDENLKVNMPKWAIPTWTRQGVSLPGSNNLVDELTEEDIMYNL
jgi:hypothetical protein